MAAPLPAETKAAILEAYAGDEPAHRIADRFGVARSTVTMLAFRGGIARAQRDRRKTRCHDDSPDVLDESRGAWVWSNGTARWVPHTGHATDHHITYLPEH